MSIATVHTHHPPTLRTAAFATLGIAAALVVGAVLTEGSLFDASSGVPARVLPADVPATVEWKIGSPDALERSFTGRDDVYRADPRGYGSPDAAERILGR